MLHVLMKNRNLFLEALIKSNTSPLVLSFIFQVHPLFSQRDIPKRPKIPELLMEIHNLENEDLDSLQLAELCTKTEERPAVFTNNIKYLEKCTKEQ